MYSLPLCRAHHTERHTTGNRAFEEKYCINLWEESARLIVEFSIIDIDQLLGVFSSPKKPRVKNNQVAVIVDPITGCHRWLGGQSNHYPSATINGERVRLNRFILEQRLGRALGPKMCALHRCDNRVCINGEHLFEGSKRLNARDMRMKGRDFRPDNRGERSYAAKLTEGLIIAARARFQRGESIASLAREYGVANETLGRAIHGKTWPELSLGAVANVQRHEKCDDCGSTKRPFRKGRCHACNERWRRRRKGYVTGIAED